MKGMEKPKDVIQTRELMCYLGNIILLPRVYIIFCVNNVIKTNHLIQNKKIHRRNRNANKYMKTIPQLTNIKGKYKIK